MKLEEIEFEAHRGKCTKCNGPVILPLDSETMKPYPGNIGCCIACGNRFSVKIGQSFNEWLKKQWSQKIDRFYKEDSNET